MGYVRVGAVPMLLNATMVAEPPPLHAKEEAFLVKRLSDIKKHGSDRWPGYLNQSFTSAVFPSKGPDGHLAGKWRSGVTAARLLDLTPPSRRAAILSRAGVRGDFFNYLVSRWPLPARGAKDVQSLTKQQVDALTPEQKAERIANDPRQKAYTEGRVQQTSITDAQGNKSTFVKDPTTGQFVPKDGAPAESATPGAGEGEGGLFDKVPGGIVTVAAAGGLVLLLLLRRK